MSRIRSVHPGLATDEAFMSMSLAAKAAWALLWTECDDHGVFEWKPIVLKARIFPADNVDFNAVLDEYISLGCIQKVEYEGKSYGLIRNFGRYQRPKNPAYKLPFPPAWVEYAGFKSNAVDKASPGLPQASPSDTEKSAQRKEEGGRRKDVEETAVAVSLAAATDLDGILGECERATGWRGLEGIAVIGRLVADGFDMDGRILPLMRDEAGKRKKFGKDAPETWAYFDKPVRDLARKPKSASKPAPPQVFVRQGEPQWQAWTEFRRSTPPTCRHPETNVEGWYFPSEWPPSHQGAAA